MALEVYLMRGWQRVRPRGAGGAAARLWAGERVWWLGRDGEEAQGLGQAM